MPLIVAEILVTVGLWLHLTELHDHAYKRLELCGEAEALDQPGVGGRNDQKNAKHAAIDDERPSGEAVEDAH